MNKIVELLIDFENTDFEDLGVEIMSLVDKPAIGKTWQAFAEQVVESFVTPNAGENEMDFIGRCVPKLINEGYAQEEAIAICYGYWQDNHSECTSCNHSDELVFTEDQENQLLEIAGKLGESFRSEDLVYIDLSKDKFSTIGDFLNGVIGLDILGQRINQEQNGITKYRYAGPSAQRNFCKAMLRMDKFYTLDEIQQMSSSIDTGFRHNGQSYSLFDFKGGVNCKHYWEEVELFKEGSKTVVVQKGKANGIAGQTMNSRSDRGHHPNYRFAAIEDQQIIVGPAMIPDMLIPRRDEMGNIFHVFFSKETVWKIAKKFMADQNQNNTDINHNENIVQENTLLESWIVEDPKMDKSTAMGFDVPAGTWMVSYKVNNKETWNKIKSGELNGYSVQGQFLQKLIK